MGSRILIVFYSRGGSVEALANAIAKGAEAEGAEVRLRRCRELVGDDILARVPGWAETAARMNAAYPAPSIADMEWADGVIFGAPTRFGAPATELRAFLDGLGALWMSNSLQDKAGAVFTSTSTKHGGTEATLLGMWPILSHLGFVIVPNGYGDPVHRIAGTPYGSASVSNGANYDPPTADDLTVAGLQGRRVARVAAGLAEVRKARA